MSEPAEKLRPGCHRVDVVITPDEDTETWRASCLCCGAFAIVQWEKKPQPWPCVWCLKLGHGEEWKL